MARFLITKLGSSKTGRFFKLHQSRLDWLLTTTTTDLLLELFSSIEDQLWLPMLDLLIRQ